MGLRKAEKQDLMLRVTKYVSEILEYKIKVQKYTCQEITQEFGLPNTRISEIRNIPKYQKPITLNIFINLLESGLIVFDELIAGVPMNETERDFIEKYRIFSDPEFKELIIKIIDAGKNPKEILRETLKKDKKK